MECSTKTQLVNRRRWSMIAGFLATALLMQSRAALADQTAPLLTPGETSVPVVTLDNPGTLLATNTDTETCTVVPGGCAAGYTQVTLVSAVYQDTKSGFLNFYYQVYDSVNSTDPAGVQVVSMNNFDGSTRVGYRDDGAGLSGPVFSNTSGTANPELINRSSLAGNTITFDYNATGSDYILPGDYSAVMVIETNATLFGAGAAHTNDGVALNFQAFEPTNSVTVPVGAPEPASLALIGGGLLLLGGLRKAAKRR